MPDLTTIDIASAQPEELGFDRKRLASIDQLRTDQVRKREMAGIVTLVTRRGKLAHLSAIGHADLATGQEIGADTIFRLYSMTKPIVSTALMMLYEEGKFRLADPISHYLPEFAAPRVLRTPGSPLSDTVAAEREPTIHDLLRHTAGFGHGDRPRDSAVDAAYLAADLFDPDSTLAGMMAKLAQIPLRHHPGTIWDYSISADVQARLIEILSGMSLETFLQRRLFDPLEMADTGYWTKDAARLAAHHWWQGDRFIPCDDAHGYPDPEHYLLERGFIDRYGADNRLKGGSNGLMSTVADYWRFSQMLLNGGALDGCRVLSPSTVRFMTRDHLGALFIPDVGGTPYGMGFGLGFATVNDLAAMGILGSEGSFFWFGGQNIMFWVDPKEELIVVIMSQHIALPATATRRFLSDVRAQVYGALVQ